MLRSVGADEWLVRDGVPGPFTTFAPMRDSWVDSVQGNGIERADPVLVVHETTRRLGSTGRPVANAPYRDVTHCSACSVMGSDRPGSCGAGR